MNLLEIIKWYHIFSVIYVIIGCRVAKTADDAFKVDMELEGIEDPFSPPSTSLGLILFWLLDFIYLFTRKTR